jgi:hypothetical protein
MLMKHRKLKVVCIAPAADVDRLACTRYVAPSIS